MRYLFSFLVSLLLTIIVSPLIISFAKKLKFGQNILNYVEAHINKQGTPTMGGLIFLFSISVSSLLFFNSSNIFAIVSIIIFISFGILGFLDDFIKIKFSRNLGLRPYQKIIGQVFLSFAVGLYAYINPLISSSVFIPFTNLTVDFGFFIIPFVMLVMIAISNSVNLIDGLDGLACSVSNIYFLLFAIISYIYLSKYTDGLEGELILQLSNLIIISSCSCGAMLGFRLFNIFPAKIFMGDTGSLSIGALMGVLAVFSKLELFIPILGILFVFTSISVIIQVLVFKLTKKRVFKMAPFHHHLEQSNLHENQIVSIYVTITIFVGILSLIFLKI